MTFCRSLIAYNVGKIMLRLSNRAILLTSRKFPLSTQLRPGSKKKYDLCFKVHISGVLLVRMSDRLPYERPILILQPHTNLTS